MQAALLCTLALLLLCVHFLLLYPCLSLPHDLCINTCDALPLIDTGWVKTNGNNRETARYTVNARACFYI